MPGLTVPGGGPGGGGPALATASCREFVVNHAADEVPQRIAAALEPRFRVVQETRRHARQVWLDTFDWRLHAAGLVLRQVNGPGAGELVLTTRAGDTVPARCAGWILV